MGDDYTEEEAERRMNAALKRALNTPPTHRESGEKRGGQAKLSRPKRDKANASSDAKPA
jgi:hypothetical protein